tara:strand:- start:581 stop:1261 length:681 start_codon:yes stop_codon:yes gene_type:complete
MRTGYTWEEVMLGIDVRNEAIRKQEEKESIEEAAAKEANLASKWAFGLSLLGAAAFGPAGLWAGKQIGKWGTDFGILPGTKDVSDWESREIDPGKFNVADTEKFNKDLKKKAAELDETELLNSVIDLGSMWVQAGGLEEGFKGDFTTFGTGDDAWTVFGRGSGEKLVEGQLIPASEDYLPGLFSSGGGLIPSLKAAAKRVGKAYKDTAAVQGGGSSIAQWYKEREA